MREDGSKPQPGPRQGPTGILLSSWVSPFHLQLQFCIAMPEYLSLVVLAKKSTFKAVLSYSGIKNWHPTLSTRQPMQLVCSVRESTRDAVEGESLAGSPSPTGRLGVLDFTCFQFIHNFLIWRGELWWQGLVWRSCRRQQRAPVGTHT